LLDGAGKFDLRGCIISAEIRRNFKGNNLLAAPVHITQGNSSIRFLEMPLNEFPVKKYLDPLSELPVAAGDTISVEGSNISNAVVTSVSAEKIETATNANVTLYGARASYQPPVLASFTPATDAAGAFTVITTAQANQSATSISVVPLAGVIANGTTLHFAARSGQEWSYIGSATLTAQANQSDISLSVAQLSQLIPSEAIAFTAPLAFYRFSLEITPNLSPGNYKWDCLIRRPTGVMVKLLRGDIFVPGAVSDL